MEFIKAKNNQRRSQTMSRASKCNGSLNKLPSVLKGEIVQDNEKEIKEKTNSNSKRKNLEKNDEAVTLQKRLKQEKVKVKAKAPKNSHSFDKSKDDALKHKMNGKEKEKKPMLVSVVSKSSKPKSSLPKPKMDERKELPGMSSGRKEKPQVKAGGKVDQRKRKLIDNKETKDQGIASSSQPSDLLVKNKSKVQKQNCGPSPAKQSKEEKETKNKNIKKSSIMVDAKRKKNIGKTAVRKSNFNEQAPVTVPKMSADNPMAMLMMMEGSHSGRLVTPHYGGIGKSQSASLNMAIGDNDTDQSHEENTEEMDDSDDSDLSDMEDVKDHTLPVEEERSQIPTEPVQITLDLPDILKRKRKKKQFDWKKYLEKQVRKFKKDVAINIHKTHILCLIAHGLRQNSILNDETVGGLCLSLVPSHLIKSANTCFSTERVVDSALSWYKKTFPLVQVTHTSDFKLISVNAIVAVISKSLIKDARIWVYLFVVVLRTLGLSVRLVLNLQPIPFKVSESAETSSSSSKTQGSSKGISKTSKSTSLPILKVGSKLKSKEQHSSSQSPSHKLSTSLSSSKAPSLSSKSISKKTLSSVKSSSSKPASKTKPSSAPQRTPSERRSSLEARVKSKKSLKEESDDDEFDDKSESSSEDCGKRDKTLKKKKGKEVVKKPKQCNTEREDSDSDFETSSPYFGRIQHELKVKSNRKILSDDEDESKYGGGQDYWLEIYLEDKKKWTCFDCFKNIYNKPYSLESRATQPVSYVVGFKNDNGVKDVTARYARQWLSQTRKMRVDADWLEQTFGIFGKASYEETVTEEDQIKSQLMVRPMPTNITDFKNHPLYALRRHLLKFEAIYPDTAVPLGYIKKEPIYARECVRTLHSRDNWLKEGRLVRLNEEPYKMVKSRPKWNKPKENPDELDLELYGEWQTEIYIPPPAFNGKVPKNEYGNVELFKPWMLPTGTVQLKVQGLQRVARKLNIDVAPAMVGWDHHSGHAHPVFDGFIVCEEFADALLDAWDEDQEIQKQKEDEKREKRVYGNWRLLIRGLLIKERLKNKFLQDAPLIEMEEKRESEGTSQKTESSSACSRTVTQKEEKQMGDVDNKSTNPEVKVQKSSNKLQSASGIGNHGDGIERNEKNVPVKIKNNEKGVNSEDNDLDDFENNEGLLSTSDKSQKIKQRASEVVEDLEKKQRSRRRSVDVRGNRKKGNA